MSDDETLPARRDFLRKSLTLIPVVTLAGAGVPSVLADDAKPTETTESGIARAGDYKPTLFTAEEWAFVNAACARLIPADDLGPGAVELGVPEFLDRHLQTPYANGAIWYMQGPFLDAAAEFGYQGRLNLKDIIRIGIKAFDDHARQSAGKPFAELPADQQDAMLKDAEGGKLKFEAISAKLFFSNFLAEVRNGFFADPSYGGNKDMGAWKMIGYPGMRADYIDWVTVRDKPYPLGPVDLSGRRG